MSKVKNNNRCTEPPSKWPESVWTARNKLKANLNSKGTHYLHSVPIGTSCNCIPPALKHESCLYPTGSAAITIVVDRMQYQRPLHRIVLLLHSKDAGLDILDSEQQASHPCMNLINKDGRGYRQCANPFHMVIEDDRTNKSRQRCAGWIWIHSFQGIQGGYWYPACIHKPCCLRYTDKDSVPTYFNVLKQ